MPRCAENHKGRSRFPNHETPLARGSPRAALTSGTAQLFLFPMLNPNNFCALQGAAIVFDLDGTVADTAADLISAANAALAEEGFGSASAGAIKPGVGYGTKAMLRGALASLQREVDEAQLQRLSERLVAHYEDRIAEKTKPFPGFTDAAAALRADGAALVLCTNKRERLALKLVAALGIDALFDAIAGGDTFPFHKPDPRHITELVRLVGGTTSAALMVGDSEADMAAAQGAGIPAVAVRFGYAAIPAEKLGASAIIDHFEELPALARRILAPGRNI
jgi:phosphoglycolate phosphatase